MADLSDRRIHPAWKERQTHANPGDQSRSGCDRPRRVLHVVTSLCTGGLSTYLLNVIANIDPLRYETHLACTHFEGPHLQEGRAYAKSVAVLSASRQPGKILRLRQLMHQLKPDVVHAHQEPAALIAARMAGVPIRLETIHLAQYWVQDGHPLIRALARRCTSRYLVYTEAERGMISHYVPRHKVQVMMPGLDSSHLSPYWTRTALPDVEPLPSSAFVIGTVARLDLQKGVEYLIEAFPSIRRACPAAFLLIVGDGALRGRLEARCRELGIDKHVRFTGCQLQGYRFLGAMDLFVMPSIFESWGFTAAEAMAAGVPVVCSDIPGPTSFVTHDLTGLVVPPADPDAIAAAVLQLWSNPSLRRSLAQAGQAHACERFSLPAMIAACEQLYGGSA